MHSSSWVPWHQWRTQDFFQGGGFNHAGPEKADWGWGGLRHFFSASKFLGQFSRHGVGVYIIHHQQAKR